MNKKINAYMMAAMMAVVSPAIMGQTASDGVKVICNDVVQKGDSVYIDAVVTVSSDAVKSRSYLELTPVLESASQKEGLPSILVNGRIRQKVYNREVALDNLNDVPHYTILKAGKEDQVVSYKTAVPFEDWMKDARVVLDPNLCGCGKEEAGSPLLIADKIRRRPDKRYEVQPTFSYRLSTYYLLFIILILPYYLIAFKQKIVKQIIVAFLCSFFMLYHYTTINAYVSGDMEKNEFLPYQIFLNK